MGVEVGAWIWSLCLPPVPRAEVQFHLEVYRAIPFPSAMELKYFVVTVKSFLN